MMALAEIRSLPWHAWSRQMLAVTRLELRKCFVGKRLIGVYALALVPVLIMAAVDIIGAIFGRRVNQIELSQGFAVFFHIIVLRFVAFFGSAGIFINIFRGEVLEKTQHYYFLTPIRRELLVAGKFLAGLSAGSIFFCFCVFNSFVLCYLPLGGDGLQKYFFAGPGLGHLGAYLGITVLACVGYGAIFTLAGLLFKNPILPLLMFYGLELVNFLLPPLLKKFSVVHYLHSVSPVPVPEGPFAFIAEPTPAIWSIGGLLVFAFLVLVLAGWLVRRQQIAYATD